MPNMTPSSTTPDNMGISRLDILRLLSMATGLMKYGTVTSGSVSAVYDTVQLKSTQYSANDWIGGWVRISSTTDNAAPEGEFRPIINYYPELGEIVPEPNFTTAPAAGDTYELWRVNPQIVLNIIDNSLTTDLLFPCMTMLSEIPDYDMEQVGTTYWTAGGGATVSKTTAEPRMVNAGVRQLSVVSTTANGYAASQTMNVQSGKRFQASAAVRCVPGTTAKLQVWDETNGAEIYSWTSDSTFPIRISFQWTAPDTCHQVSYRLITVTAGGTTYWNEVVGFGYQSRDLALPWWVHSRGQVKGVFQYFYWSINVNIWDVTLSGEVDDRWDIIQSYGGGNNFRVLARQGFIQWPLYILGTRFEVPYTSETTDLKYLNPDVFTSCIKYQVYEFLSQPLEEGILDSRNFKEEAAKAKAEWLLLSQEYAENLNTTIQSTDPWIRVSSPFTFGEYNTNYGPY